MDPGRRGVIIRLNKLFITISATWASLNSEFELASGSWLSCIDKITQLWSCIIVVTNAVKWFYCPNDVVIIPRRHSATNMTHDALLDGKSYPTLRDILLLDYLPTINAFGNLYYGLLLIAIAAPLIWRIYLNYYRPRRRSRWHSNHDVKKNLVQFFANGYHRHSDRSVNMGYIATVLSRCSAVLEDTRHPDSKPEVGAHRADHFHMHMERVLSGQLNQTLGFKKRKLVGHLARLHPDRKFEPNAQEEAYKNPIRIHHFLEEYTEARWNSLARHLYIILVIVIATSIPILYFAIGGFHSVMRYFTIDDDADLWTRALQVYGTMEQFYACTQAAIFFVFTNMFITLFHADLMSKVKPLEDGLTSLNKLYKSGFERAPSLADIEADARYSSRSEFPISREEIHRQQLRLWAYFDNIIQLDCFVSKFSQISLFTFVIGLLFGQSYLKVDDETLKRGTEAVLLSNFLSFSYLYVVSWDIEQRSTKLHKTILAIIARDRDLVTRRIWQKTLNGFYESDWRRTFSLNGRYPLNLHSYSRTMFGVVTMSFLIHRLFHKHSWEGVMNSETT